MGIVENLTLSNSAKIVKIGSHLTKLSLIM